MNKKLRIHVLFGLILLLSPSQFSFANVLCEKKSQEDTSCTVCNDLLAIINRPSNADSACVVPLNKFLIEMGYRYLNLHGGGRANIYPDMELRLGILGDNEVIGTLPSYVSQTVSPTSGWTPSQLGLKHEIGHSEKLVAAIEGLYTLPSGSDDFGSAHGGGTVNVILDYLITKKASFTLMLGGASLSAPKQQGGQHYNTFNPDLLFTWQPKDKYQLYAEVYGQTSTGPRKGAGANGDVGVQYLLNKQLEIDVSFGQRLFGELGGFNNYLNIGLGLMI